MIYTVEWFQREFPNGQCICVTTHPTPEAALASGKIVLYGPVTADSNCHLCHGTGNAKVSA